MPLTLTGDPGPAAGRVAVPGGPAGAIVVPSGRHSIGDGYVRVIIDGRFVLDEADLHRRLAGALGYGPYYRHDLACLRERLCAGDPRPLQLIWIHTAGLRLALGREPFARFVAVLTEVEAGDEGKPWAQRLVFRLFD